MALVLFDSNILIDCLGGIKEALDELEFWDGPAISSVTWMEVRAGMKPGEETTFDAFVNEARFEIIHIDDTIMREASRIRGESIRKGPKLALMDAIIRATASVHDLMIVTRNTKDFKGAGVRVPYELQTSTVVSVVNVAPHPGKPTAVTRRTINILVEGSAERPFTMPIVRNPPDESK
jgi:predicted nucleic acid-binding protein